MAEDAAACVLAELSVSVRPPDTCLPLEAGRVVWIKQRKEPTSLSRRVFQNVNIVWSLSVAVERAAEAVEAREFRLQPLQMRPTSAVEENDQRLIGSRALWHGVPVVSDGPIAIQQTADDREEEGVGHSDRADRQTLALRDADRDEPVEESLIAELGPMGGEAARPDLDNFLKAVLDACNGIVFFDDAQITEINARKIYGIAPKTVLTVTPFAEDRRPAS